MKRRNGSRLFGALVFGLLIVLAACKKEPSATPVTTKCKSADDCTWAFKARGECCTNPCATGTPVHLDENAAIIDYNAWYCTDDRRKACPQAGACNQTPGPAGTLKCNDGACVAVSTDAGP